MLKNVFLGLACMVLAIVTIAPTDLRAEPAVTKPAVTTLEWPNLVPPGYNPDEVMEQYQKKYQIDKLKDDDPKVKELQAKLKELWTAAPVNSALNGKMIKLPGFVIPLETDGKHTSEFLLVPYYGACIHVPPPPANQTVYVKSKEKSGATIRKMFDTVWVTGVLKTEKLSTELADAGYVIEAAKVEPFE